MRSGWRSSTRCLGCRWSLRCRGGCLRSWCLGSRRLIGISLARRCARGRARAHRRNTLRGAQERLLTRGRQLAVRGDGVAQHDRHVVHRGGLFRLLRLILARQRLHAAGEHHVAIWATGGDLLRAGLQRLFGAELVDAAAEVFLHEHPGTARATAKRLFARLVHFFELHASGLQQLTRRVIDAVVAAQEARVVVRNRLAVVLGAGDRSEQLFPHQPVEQLRVMEDVKVPVEVRVLVAQRVKAVRAGGDDLPLPLRYALKGFVEGLHILLRHHLEQELVAGAAGRIARAGFTGGQHAELHTGGVK